MTGFRGSDESLDREIETLEKIARLRVRRYASDLRDVDRELKGLRSERAKRRAQAMLPVEEPVTTGPETSDEIA